MMKKRLILYCITLMLFCQVYPCKVMAVSESKQSVIVDHCVAIREQLKLVQKNDARARVNLGAYYETILTKFVMPLNVRLVENNLSSGGFVDNQNELADTKAVFVKDYVGYQKELEELVNMDCKNEPEAFYNKLVKVRLKRKTMDQDVLKIRTIISEHIKLVNGLKGKL